MHITTRRLTNPLFEEAYLIAKAIDVTRLEPSEHEFEALVRLAGNARTPLGAAVWGHLLRLSGNQRALQVLTRALNDPAGLVVEVRKKLTSKSWDLTLLVDGHAVVILEIKSSGAAINANSSDDSQLISYGLPAVQASALGGSPLHPACAWIVLTNGTRVIDSSLLGAFRVVSSTALAAALAAEPTIAADVTADLLIRVLVARDAARRGGSHANARALQHARPVPVASAALEAEAQALGVWWRTRFTVEIGLLGEDLLAELARRGVRASLSVHPYRSQTYRLGLRLLDRGGSVWCGARQHDLNDDIALVAYAVGTGAHDPLVDLGLAAAGWVPDLSAEAREDCAGGVPVSGAWRTHTSGHSLDPRVALVNLVTQIASMTAISPDSAPYPPRASGPAGRCRSSQGSRRPRSA